MAIDDVLEPGTVRELAAKLRERGREVASIDGGMKAWEGEKFPMQPSTDPDDDLRV
jgi:hypothetical protein